VWVKYTLPLIYVGLSIPSDVFTILCVKAEEFE